MEKIYDKKITVRLTSKELKSIKRAAKVYPSVSRYMVESSLYYSDNH